MSASYEEAVRTLNTLQSNAATIARTVAERDKKKHLSIPETTQQAIRAGVSLSDLDKLSLIHVSGTKGKGSTCAFCESILRAHGLKTGFFSSPHLVEVRERIRINGQPLSKEAFSNYFWDCYRKLDDTKAENDGAMPPYFRFLTIMAFHVFIQEKVDVAIIEVGIGGLYDSTNIIRTPVVCGVTSLGMDHMSILGDTIQKIAAQKAGIFKEGVPVVSILQRENSEDVLKEKAQTVGCPLYLAPSLDDYTWATEKPTLGIPGCMQETNASIALQLCNIWLKNHTKDHAERCKLYSNYEAGVHKSAEQYAENAQPFEITQKMAKGLAQCRWPGRSQKLRRANVTFYIDGAHTPNSIQSCAKWFNTSARLETDGIRGKVVRILLFNTTGDRKPESLLEYLVPCGFDAAVFCPNIATLSENEGKADQMNLTVTKDMQLGKCIQNRNAWLDLLTHQPDILTVPCKRSKTEEKSSSTDQIGDHNDDNTADAVGVHSLSCAEENVDQLCVQTLGSIQHALFWASQGRDPSIGGSLLNVPAIPSALKDADHIQVLCTGSLHLVGGVLGLIDPNLEESMV